MKLVYIGFSSQFVKREEERKRDGKYYHLSIHGFPRKQLRFLYPCSILAKISRRPFFLTRSSPRLKNRPRNGSTGQTVWTEIGPVDLIYRQTGFDWCNPVNLHIVIIFLQEQFHIQPKVQT